MIRFACRIKPVSTLLSQHKTVVYDENVDELILWKIKRGDEFLSWFSYGRFLSINTASITTITTSRANMATIAGTKYVSATDKGSWVGEVVVACASKTPKAVAPCEGQYP